MALAPDNIVHIITMGKTEAGLNAVAVSEESKQRNSCIGVTMSRYCKLSARSACSLMPWDRHHLNKQKASGMNE